ncbi:unnamed protein product [Rotaria sordida]|uniref:Uncharacterized protein n=1 Tax=Rotaria sordida TaxID=392033 RepID=A0A818QN76_9BILA|nr:unnamed protein product [Rotaria sordida]
MTGQFSLIATISDSLEKLIDILEAKENLTIDSKELLIILNNFHNDRIIIENSLNEYQVQREMLCLRTGCEAYKETAKYLSQLYILLRDSNIELKISIKWLI